MLSTFDENATVCVEPTRKGFELNRGSLVENLVKMALLDTDNGFKTAQRKSDIGRNIIFLFFIFFISRRGE